MYDWRYRQHSGATRTTQKWLKHHDPKRGTPTDAQVIDLATKFVVITIDTVDDELKKQRNGDKPTDKSTGDIS